MRFQTLILPIISIVWLLSANDIKAQEKIPRIINGVPTDVFESVGIIGSLQRGGFCTGTLISSTHVLTAAHCAEIIESESTGTFEVGGDIYLTARIHIHPDYNSRTLENDIAILELSEPVAGIEPSLVFRDRVIPGDLLTIVGFGSGGDSQSGSNGDFGTKRVGQTMVENVTSTRVIWVFDDPSEGNSASGDSGGPGFIDVGGTPYIASITSAGTDPDSGLGDIAYNTRVDAYSGWIDSTVAVSVEPGTDDPVTDDPETDDPVTDDPVTDDPDTGVDDDSGDDKVCPSRGGKPSSVAGSSHHGFRHRPAHRFGSGGRGTWKSGAHIASRNIQGPIQRSNGPAAGRCARRK